MKYTVNKWWSPEFQSINTTTSYSYTTYHIFSCVFLLAFSLRLLTLNLDVVLKLIQTMAMKRQGTMKQMPKNHRVTGALKTLETVLPRKKKVIHPCYPVWTSRVSECNLKKVQISTGPATSMKVHPRSLTWPLTNGGWKTASLLGR